MKGADHLDRRRLALTYKPRPEWEPYVDAVLAQIAASGGSDPPVTVATSERETGLEPATSSLEGWRSTI